ncbi:hypothetical protein [Rubellicoccus peritrichatus]|uniref:Uncharacterized protein n=1 Tax=Rubellicoccus peritrichatus TaxID=3080537 RepID=A0AAQ3QUU7_9BACT|nr:hypothetical protein [Puniceicoccus sp. CR14]WOO40290.1 hypothetical protein RZN69_16850 [Puniceicoccus sp. CR14]
MSAQFQLYEGFDTPGTYANDIDITTQSPSGGIGDWVGDWSSVQAGVGGEFKSVSASMNYTDTSGNILQTTNGSLQRTGGATTTINRALDQSLYTSSVPQNGGTSWFSLIVDVDNTGPSTRFDFNVGDGQNRGPGFVLDSNGVLSARINNAGFDNTTTLSDGVYFLLGRTTFSISTNPTLDLWINPILDESELGAASLTVTGGSFGASETDQVTLRTRNGSIAHVDEIRVANTFDGVVTVIPEPAYSVVALTLITIGGMLIMRRKRN